MWVKGRAKRGVGEQSEQEASPESRYHWKSNDCDVASCASGTQPALRLGWGTPTNGYPFSSLHPPPANTRH